MNNKKGIMTVHLYWFDKKGTKISLLVHRNYSRSLLLTKVSLILRRTSARVFCIEKSVGASPCHFPPVNWNRNFMKRLWSYIHFLTWSQSGRKKELVLFLFIPCVAWKTISPKLCDSFYCWINPFYTNNSPRTFSMCSERSVGGKTTSV